MMFRKWIVSVGSRFNNSMYARTFGIMTQRSLCAEEELMFEKRGQVQHVTLNRPGALNALNLSMVRDLTRKLKEFVKDPETSVITLRGAGDKAFCAGGDLKSLTLSAREDDNYGRQFFYEEFSLCYMIGTCPKPLISIMNGITFGGGAGLTVIGRFCVATERTTFCMPECAIGLFTDVGSGHFLSRLPGNIGMYLGLTGHRLKGHDIARVGLASHYIDYSRISQLDSALESLQAPVTMGDIQYILDEFQRASAASSSERCSLEQHMEQIARCFHGECVEDIVRNLQQENTDWSHKQLTAIKKMSPTSLKLTFRLVKEGKATNLAETLKKEYRLTQRCFKDKDFHEGIRATIIDKDGQPHWSPSSLEEVTSERIDHYFSPLGQELELELNSSNLFV